MASLPVAQAREDVAALFLSYLGRAPEFEAMNYYVGLYNQLLAAQGDAAAAADNAFKALSAQIYVDAGNIGEIPAGPSVTDGEYVDWIYQNVLGRAADEAGRAYWLEQLADGAIDRADLVGIVVAAAQNDVRDAAYLANRTEVALEFAKFENSNPQIIGSLKFNAKQVLEGVNEDPATVTAAEAKLVSATNGGESFTLTVGVDNIVGTSGDDVFNAVPVNPTNSAAATTLNAFDTIDGGTGRDTLNIYTDGTHNVVQQGTVRNVEVINIYNVQSGSAFGGSSVDASKFAGAEEVWQHGRAVEVKGLSASTVAGFAELTALDLSVSSAAAAAKATVVLDNVTANGGDLSLNFTGAALKDVVVLGAVNDADEADVLLSIKNTDDKAKDVTVTLATEVDATVFLSGKGIVALDASASTGDIEYAFSGNVKSVKGGAGDDVFVFGADRALTLTDNVDGGEGVNTVVLAQGGTFVTQDYNALDRLQNIDTLALIGQNVQIDAAELTAFDTLAFGGAGLIRVANLAADQALTVFDNDAYGFSEPESVVLVNAAADVTLTLSSSLAAGPKVLVTDKGAFVSDDYFGVGPDLEDELGGLVGEQGATGGTLSVDGEGFLAYSNAGGKFATIDISDFDGLFALYGMAGDVAETVIVGEDALAIIALDVSGGSSTLGLTDVIEGFVVPDFSEGLTQAKGSVLFGLGNIDQIDVAAGASQGAAFEAAALAYAGAVRAENDVVLFHWEGDTYLYAGSEQGVEGKYNTTDFLIQIVGTFSDEDLVNPLV